jgi:hypothetical protein
MQVPNLDDGKPWTSERYRARWLIAHNFLHALGNDDAFAADPKLREHWNKYLAQLEKADEIAGNPA